MTTNEPKKTSSGDPILFFTEGIIGFPHLRHMALVSLPDFSPFFQLAPLDDPNTRFVVVEPQILFPDYQPHIPNEIRIRVNLSPTDIPLTLVFVIISSDWKKTRINLRAPLFINPATMHGAQAILSDSRYKLDELLPKHVLIEEGE